jgi:hypothetical protein
MPAKVEKHEVEKDVRYVAHFVTDPRLPEVLQGLVERQEARDEAKKDPKGYLTRKGISLPAEAKVRFEQSSPKWKLTLCFWVFCISFEHS